jgi:hypothetical protein
MTQDEIIEIARQADLFEDCGDCQGMWAANSKQLEAFAKLVAAKEREKLLLLSTKAHDVDGNCNIVLVADIRARGEA